MEGDRLAGGFGPIALKVNTVFGKGQPITP